jgi:molecular chaperone GrpE
MTSNDEGKTPPGPAGRGDAAGPDAGRGSRDETSQEDVILSASELDELRKKADERDAYRNELLRSKADFENYQRRTRKEKPLWEEQAVRRFVRELLPVCDNLERALEAGKDPAQFESFEEGVRLTYQILQRLLSENEVVEIPAAGEVFNPELHEAVSQVVVDDVPTGVVTDVLEKGYRHRDVVVRPSRVNVARNVRDDNVSGDNVADRANSGQTLRGYHAPGREDGEPDA